MVTFSRVKNVTGIRSLFFVIPISGKFEGGPKSAKWFALETRAVGIVSVLASLEAVIVIALFNLACVV